MPNFEERHESLRVAKKLNKFIPLPNVNSWKVHGNDVLRRGRVLCFLRTKNTFFPDDLSTLKMRTATVTKQGFMVLYEDADRGLIIDLRAATHVLTECDKYKSKKVKYSRSHIKIRLPRGNVHLFVRDDNIHKWTCAILEAHVSARPKPARPTVSEEVTAVEATATSSNSGLITVIERPTTSEAQISSIRHGVVPVGTLRQKLEDSLPKAVVLPKQEVPEEPKFVSSLFLFHEGMPVEQEVSVKLEQPSEDSEDDKTPKKEWWMRSLRC